MTDDQQSAQARVSVRRMIEGNLPVAKKIFQLAFGTFAGVPEPESFLEDRDYVNARWRVGASTPWSPSRLKRAERLSPRFLGSRHRPKADGTDHGDFRRMEDGACRPFYLFAQPQAFGTLSQIWILAALSYRIHVQAGGERCRCRNVIVLCPAAGDRKGSVPGGLPRTHRPSVFGS